MMTPTLMLTSKGVAAVPRSLARHSGRHAGTPSTCRWKASRCILGVDTLMDMGRTSVNLLGNCLRHRRRRPVGGYDLVTPTLTRRTRHRPRPQPREQ